MQQLCISDLQTNKVQTITFVRNFKARGDFSPYNIENERILRIYILDNNSIYEREKGGAQKKKLCIGQVDICIHSKRV